MTGVALGMTGVALGMTGVALGMTIATHFGLGCVADHVANVASVSAGFVVYQP
jgi:hypothetical protein